VRRHDLRENYLPDDPTFGLSTKMAADFRTLHRVPRIGLEGIRQSRIARLNATAIDHFRESLGYFFRRYAFDEWYPLSKAEFEAYKAMPGRDSSAPFPWQT